MPRVVAVPSINRDTECRINLSLLFAINGDGSICNKKWNWDLGGAAVRYDRYISDLAEMQARYLLFDFGHGEVKRRAPVSDYARATDGADPETIRSDSHRR